MTNKEALQAMLPMKVPDNLIVKTFNEHDLNDGDTYSPSLEKEIDMVYVELLNYILIHPNISEGGLNMKFDKGFLLHEIDRVLKKHGITDNLNISDGTHKW